MKQRVPGFAARTPAASREATGVRKDSNLWRKVKFGYGLHVDTKYEIPVAFGVGQASRAETKKLDGDKLFEETPLLEDFGADRGSGPAKLWDRYGIRPLYAPRGKKRTTPANRPLFDDNQRGEELVLKPTSNGP